VTEHDVLVGFRLRLFTLADELGNVSAACRAMGVDRSTYYRLKAKVDRWGLEALDVRERRRPRMPNQIGPHLEQRIVAFSLGHPGLGPRRISAELAREKWGAIRISEHGVWRVLCRVGLNTRSKRLALIARHRDPYERRPDPAPPERHIDATQPGEKVQLDCFYVGRLSGTKGTVWQYTAIDVASAYTWAQLHASERNPRSRHTRELLHRVAAELAAAGWKLREVTTDNGSEFRAKEFRDAVAMIDARQRFIRAGRRTPTAASNASSSPSSKSAGAPPSPARSFPAAPPSPATSTNTSPTTTTIAPTPGASPKDAYPQISSSAPTRPASRDDTHLSPHLGVRTA
jgi:transposase InsO family protein